MKKNVRLYALCMVCILAVQLFVATCPAYAEETGEKENKEHVLLFTADLHDQVEEKLIPFLKRYKETVDQTEYICYGGDYAKQFDEKILKRLVRINQQLFPSAKSVYTVGNHDMAGFDKEKFQYITNMKERGNVIKKGGYVLYTFGASSKEQQFTETDVKELKEFLETTREYIPRIPIIIVSHFPIHYFENGKDKRQTKGSEELVKLLNAFSNVVFLYGHNHSVNDTSYGVIHMPGDEITIGKNEFRTINFCYTSLGAMKDGANQEIYALKITIKNTVCCNQVMLEHLNYYAEPKDKMMVCFPLVEEY
ncbi:MAG: metallophosphoesterase [bacterium]|nr:metallophosphoesterase [bacterium]